MVRHLSLWHTHVVPSILDGFVAGWGPEPLFPNLRSVLWGAWAIPSSFLNAVLCPSITEISIFPHTEALFPALLDALPGLQSICPALRAIRIALRPRGQVHDVAAIAAFAQHCQPLRALRLPCVKLDADALAHIGSLPGLEIFEMSASVDQTIPEGAKFRDLNELVLTGHLTPDFCIAFMRKIHPISLRRLDLAPNQQRFGQQWGGVLSAINDELLAQATLTELILHEQDPSDDMPGMFPDQQPLDIRPLLAFTNLTHVDVRVLYAPDPTDSELRALAQSWPRIRHLDLLPAFEWARYETPRATLWGLVPFAEFCLELRRLHLYVDACSPTRYAGKPGGGAACRALRALHVGGSPIAHATIVAAFLSDIFPALRAIRYYNVEIPIETPEGAMPEGRRQRLWAKVQSLLPTLGAIRVLEHLPAGGEGDEVPVIAASDTSVSDESDTDSANELEDG